MCVLDSFLSVIRTTAYHLGLHLRLLQRSMITQLLHKLLHIMELLKSIV